MPPRKPIFENHYDLLQVSHRASREVIEAAYRALIQRHHPDHNGSTEMAAALNVAHAVLSDPRQRRDYDRERRVVDPKTIDGYRVISKIAEGGFGKTYKGEETLTGLPVCVKHCTEISPDHDAILIEEARAMGSLGCGHYSIPQYHKLVRLDDGSMALVMAFIEGKTISQVVEKLGPLDAEHVAWIAQRVLHALFFLHVHGIIHGDLKPQNIILPPDTHNAVLVDFGLAMIKPRAADKAKGYTDLFAPPEQMAGQVLIPESDIYSLGMTMIFMLTGGDVNRMARKQVPRSVPEPMCDFIRSLTHKEPMDRPRVWEKDDLREEVEQMRQQSFGRIHSNLKPLDF
jgi:serine/threonine protein kinase